VRGKQTLKADDSFQLDIDKAKDDGDMAFPEADEVKGNYGLNEVQPTPTTLENCKPQPF